MFLADDILLAPFKGLVALSRQVQDAARQDLETQKSDLMTALAQLHKQLESGEIGETEFNIQESQLLERLDEIENTLDPGA